MSTTDTADSRPAVDDARGELENAVPKAARTLADLLDAEDDRVRIRAAEAILDRAGVVKGKKTTATTAARNVGGEQKGDLGDLF